MRQYLLSAVAFVALSSSPLAALAQETAAPEDSWFRAEDDAAPNPPQVVVQSPQVVVQPAQPVAAPPPVVIIIVPGGQAPVIVERQAPVVIERPAPAPATMPQPRIVVTRPAQPKVVKPARVRKDAPPSAGFDFHMQYLSYWGRMGRNSAPNAGLLGAGANLRIQRDSQREWQIGNEFLMGKDFNGFDRSEVGLSVLRVHHLNPNRPLRFYGIGGVNLWFGDLRSDKQNPLTPAYDKKNGSYYAQYGALGLQAGLGAELRLTQSFSIHTDLLGMFRWRFVSTQDSPEYFARNGGDPTNTYPAWFLRAGLTYWPDKKK